MLCGNSGPNGQGLDALTPVPSCDLYATGNDVTQFYNQLVAASGRRKLKFFGIGGGGIRNDCRGCRRNCRCGNGNNFNLNLGLPPKASCDCSLQTPPLLAAAASCSLMWPARTTR